MLAAVVNTFETDILESSLMARVYLRACCCAGFILVLAIGCGLPQCNWQNPATWNPVHHQQMAADDQVVASAAIENVQDRLHQVVRVGHSLKKFPDVIVARIDRGGVHLIIKHADESLFPG